MTKRDIKKTRKGMAVRIVSGKAKPVFGILQEVTTDCLAQVKVGKDMVRTVPLGHVQPVKG